MTDFTLDTSGGVYVGEGYGDTLWSDLSPFEQGYVEALFASAMHESLRDTRSPKTFDQCGFSDLAAETLAAILKDCEGNAAFSNTQDGGRQFWATRQRGAYAVHGGLRPLTPYLDDTGKVRLREAG